MLAASGSVQSFDYVAYDGDATLFVAGEVRNITGGIPGTLVALVPMTHAGDGLYLGKVAGGLAGEIYSVKTSVYTDGTYSTINADRPQGGKTFDFEDLSADGGSGGTGEVEVIGLVDGASVIGVVDESDQIVGSIDQAETVGVIHDGDLLTGSIENEGLIGTVEECV